MTNTPMKSIPSSISIALCTYQAEKFLKLQLDSLFSQTHKNFDLHIFDDCSDDSTIDIISNYKKKYTNIHLVINESQLGFVKNFEQAIATLSSTGNYIALCDQDDVWHGNKLKHCLCALKSLEQKHPNKPLLIHSDLRLIDEKGKCIQSSFFTHKHLELPTEKSLAKILSYNGVMGNTLLMNRQLAQLALPFPNSLKYHDYWLAIVNEIFGVRTTLKQQLVDYRIHSSNASENRASKKTNRTPSKLPFMMDNRDKTLRHLLSHYDLAKEDRKIVEAFCSYLHLQKNKLSLFMLLLKYGFLRNNWSYRLRVFYKILSSFKNI